MSNVDLHMHCSASDGTDTPEELLYKIRRSGITAFSVTDHDTISGAMRMEEIAGDDVTFIRGIEFSCWAGSGKCHILGFDYDPSNAEFISALEMVHTLRREKLEARLSFLLYEVGVPFSDEELANIRAMPGVFKPYLADIIVKKGFAKDRSEAIKGYLDKCGEKRTDRIPAVAAIRAIRAAGGVPVWAHPLGGEGDAPVSEDRFRVMLRYLTGYGILGLECYYSRYTMPEAEWLSDRAMEMNLMVSGGSDYHGGNRDTPLGKLNQYGRDVPAEKLSVLTHILQRRSASSRTAS